jgi:hypothetical protein
MKVTVNIASIPSRAEMLINTIKSISSQVNKINVCLNGYDKNPLLKHSKINVVMSDNSLGDAGKFMFDCEGYVLTIDDDLIYPDNYVLDMVMNIDKFGVVTHHGKTFKNYPIESYYSDDPYIRVRCLQESNYFGNIDFAGTGVLGYHTSVVNPKVSEFKTPNMADIYFSAYCRKNNVKIKAIPHKFNYIKYQFPKHTIWDDKVKDDSFETNFVNSSFM